MASGYEACYYTGVLGWVWGRVHAAMERRYRSLAGIGTVLELGAGHGQHAHFVKHPFDRYVASDLRAELVRIPEADPRFQVASVDASDLSQFGDGTIDRLVATCLLVHLPDPYAALGEWRRVLTDGGHATIYVPCEPSWLNRTARSGFIWPRARRHGAEDPELLAYQGHQVHYPAMRTFIDRTFAGDDVSRTRYPVPGLPWNLSLFEIVHVRKIGPQSEGN
ncbi:class I SAM-dependent methyltransferase [Nocardioides piscis]|uniref:Class I SAM-dependent methyltransferase n=1 Tax=Nocardioides piscis TaxID=2714938 RepID=A0A6G7YF85_9ACTN|nr:class I SAM-dependent methyltransferase [Nocardioides piscis]QIK75453.1 class I SAM-dependent methyltransferase [Nocardioides piscis]